MSGSHKPQDGFCFGPTDLTEFERAILFSNFDYQTDYDVMDINEEIKETKNLRKVCLYKLFLFVPEVILTELIFGAEASDYKKKAGRLFWRFYRNKITLEVFKKELTSIMNNGKII